MDKLIIETTAILFVIIVLTRALPFVLSHEFAKSQTIAAVGKQLPFYIMVLLVIYEVGLKGFFSWPYHLPAVVALVLLSLVHIWRRQVLLSLVVGVAVFITLNHYFLIPCSQG